MPILQGGGDMDDGDVKIKAFYDGSKRYSRMVPDISIDAFLQEIRRLLSIDPEQEFTVKWLDEEDDACTISSQLELDEAIRLYYKESFTELKLHVFASVPMCSGLLCPGEDPSIYRKGARRWKKLYHANGHVYQKKRLNRFAVCHVCRDRIWGFGSPGFKCVNCRLLVHRRCHEQVRVACEPQEVEKQRKALYPLDHVNTLSSASSTLKNSPSVDDGISATLERRSSRPPSILKTSNRRSFQNGIPPPSVVDLNPGSALLVENGAADSKAPSLDDFNLLRVIGRGSYAKVFVVELKKTKRIYAMKVIKKELIKEDEDIEWVQTEKHVFETASNYPFLVGLHSSFQTPSRLFFIIEFVSGGDLMYHMQKQKKLHENHARFYAAEITLALNYLHRRGIIYRDLKLDNVLLDADGHIRLTDYGMCKEGISTPENPTSQERTETFCGTPNYIAPEILQGKPYSFSVDWWALGVLMFEMLVGKSPFEIPNAGDNQDQETEDALFQVILEKVIRIPRNLRVEAASVLKGFLNKDPTERLGCKENGVNEILDHVFFKTINFEQLEAKHIPPPFKPQVHASTDAADGEKVDLHNFDPQFTSEAVQLTPDDESVIRDIDQSEFEGFDYVNPLLMSHEESV
ncbi:hypothetical protein RvY_11568 [Ramazzottius varieornatus]|uniref:protein kinase C n=1 Tax=Ramazzottius varieornatus TaxID=947166 RepID=A0A1D1VGI7_RAMVA|nr:hypothetical protein RvY_11568 [Ramazzottius varieornatus]